MKILYLNTINKWGGGEKQTIYALDYLRQRGHQVFLGCLPGSPIHKKAQEKGLAIFPYSLKMDIAFWMIPPLRRFLEREKIEVMVCAQTKDVKIGGLAGRLAGVPAIFSYQGLELTKRKIDHRIAFTRFIDGIITNTRSIKDKYLRFGWFPENFIHVVYGGIELPRNVETVNLRDKFELPATARIILSAGRLSHQKGFDLLIRAAQMAKAKNLDWVFLIAGTGKLKNNLQQLIRTLDVEDRVRLIGFQSDVLPFMKAADLFVLPSRFEGMPNAVREAMAVGQACVATAVNGVPELIENEKSGLLVESENVQQLFDAMYRALNDNELRTELGKNALRRVTEIFTIDNMIDRLEAIFSAQLRRSGGKDPRCRS